MDKAFDNATEFKVDINNSKFIIFSDQHFGDGKRGSDDFSKNREIYKNALQHYYDNHFTYISVGDNEELWECDFPKISDKYTDIYEIEKGYFDDNRHFRIIGNHDIFWNNTKFIKKHLSSIMPEIFFHDSIKLTSDSGTIFITHGHQGDFVSDFFWPVSRLLVRYIWKPFQRITNKNSTGPAQNVKKRNKVEKEYYNWAKEKKLIFIAGHTHRAMFASLSKIDRINLEIATKQTRLKTNYDDDLIKEIEELNNKRNEIITKEFGNEELIEFDNLEKILPNYFNDGCCCYSDGITGIEIENGNIRLVKWEASDNGESIRKIYEEDRIANIFDIINFK